MILKDEEWGCSGKATGGVFTIGGFSPPVTMTCTYCRRLYGRTHFIRQQLLLCMTTYSIEWWSTNTRQVLTQFNEAAVYVGVSYAEEKEDFIQQVVICCYPSPARLVCICTMIVSYWSVHIYMFWSSSELNGRPYGRFGLLFMCGPLC